MYHYCEGEELVNAGPKNIDVDWVEHDFGDHAVWLDGPEFDYWVAAENYEWEEEQHGQKLVCGTHAWTEN